MKWFSFFFLFSFAAHAAFFGLTNIVSAQNTPFVNDAEGLTLSPPLFDMTLNPGENTAYTIRVTNPTKKLIELYPSAGNFSASGEGGEPKYEIGEKAIENNSRFSIANWVSFFEPKIALLPEQVVEFRFRITVPENAEPGGHYGVVFLGTKPPEEITGASQVSLSTMVGSLLLVRIPGDVHESMTVDEFSVPWFFFAPPVAFTTYLRNTGNVHVRPMGEIVITDWRGHDRERLDINQSKGNILPESRRKFDATWTSDAKYFWEVPIGKFHATLKTAYGQSNRDLTQTVDFWIIPKWFIITVSILLFLILLLITFLTLRRRKRQRTLERPGGGKFFPAFKQKNPVRQPTERIGNHRESSLATSEPSPYNHTAMQQYSHPSTQTYNQQHYQSYHQTQFNAPTENIQNQTPPSIDPIQRIQEVNKAAQRIQNKKTQQSFPPPIKKRRVL